MNNIVRLGKHRAREARSTFFADMRDMFFAELQKSGIDEATSLSVSEHVTQRMEQNWGGQNLTIPRNTNRQLRQFEDEVLAEFTGFNYADLAAKHKYTERGMRVLIARALERKHAPAPADGRLRSNSTT